MGTTSCSNIKEKLLEELVEIVITEKIRSKTFDIAKFKALASDASVSLNQARYNALAYANQRLQQAGKGTSRIAYVLSSSRVLKVARSPKGLAQNEAEIDVYTDPRTKPIVAKIYDYDSEFVWVISEIVRPFHDSTHTPELTSYNTSDRMSFTWTELEAEVTRFLQGMGTRSSNPELKRYAASISDLIQTHDLALGDALTPDHWGMTADGRLVLLDYGGTWAVLNAHY